MESKKDSILLKEQKLMCLKNRALWLKARDKNTIFFHKFSSHRKNINTIFEIKNRQANMVRYFEDKAEAGVDLFQNIFKEL